MQVNYTPSPTIRELLLCNDSIQIIKGPFGSGKSVGAVMKILKCCMEQPRQRDGLRRSRWSVVRNTRDQLKDTTLKTFFEWVPPGVAGVWKETERVFYLQFGDVRAEIMFRSLDKPSDVVKTLSLEVTGIWLNECREIPQEIFNALDGRHGRYPRVEDGGCAWHGIIADTNPPEEDSFWGDMFEKGKMTHNGEDLPERAIFSQPSGLSAEAENVEHLPPGYYERLAKGKGKSWVDMYVHGLTGISQAGRPVYKDTFNQDVHVAKEPLLPNPMLPLVIGMDFGLDPAAIFMQLDVMGRLRVLKEVIAHGMGIERFIIERLRPALTQAGQFTRVLVVGDPAGTVRSQTDERTCYWYLKKARIKAKPAQTNAPIARIAAVESFLSRTVSGDPACLIDPSCTVLITGARSKYRYKKQRDGTFDDTPEKNDYSHPHDAWQYGCLELSGGQGMSTVSATHNFNDPFEQLQQEHQPSYRPADAYAGY